SLTNGVSLAAPLYTVPLCLARLSCCNESIPLYSPGTPCNCCYRLQVSGYRENTYRYPCNLKPRVYTSHFEFYSFFISNTCSMTACSFLPAATRMIYDMGLQHDLHGVTFECHHNALAEKLKEVRCVL